MLRRRFIEVLAAVSALAADGMNAFRSRLAQAASPSPASRFSPGPAPAGSAGFTLAELLIRRTLPLGTLKSHKFFVSLDDIAAHWYPAGITGSRNALVISAYEDEDKAMDSALVRAVLAALRIASPADYRKVNEQLGANDHLDPKRVLLPFSLNIPPAQRHSFPFDNLLAVIFAKGSSDNEGFDWVGPVFEAAAPRRVANLIVPCLGRCWTDKRTIEFDEFYRTFLAKVPSGEWPGAVYFSLYGQWPSFELANAAKALDGAWKKSLS